MTTQRKILWTGLLLYVLSFFLVAASHGWFGFSCALAGLLLPWGNNLFGHDGIFEHKVFDYICVLISGLVNPIFLIAAFLAFRERHRGAVAILRIVIVLMIPLSWVVFHYESLYPREGHFLWIVGMVLVLFSNELARGHHVDRIPIGFAKPL